KNLLCHQSGIANPFPLKWIHLASEHADFDYERFSNTIILNHLELKRSPGKKFAYSNINYLVLGRLIEEINTKKYQDYITDNILTRLPSNEYIGFDIPESNHASGYHPNTWFQNFILGFLINKDKMIYKADENWNGFNPFYINGAPYGGIISSPRTLMTFCQSLLNGNGVLRWRRLLF
ncbi:MAG: serine hydrolase, partial [Cyclobacteriaceae bacterium]